MCEKTAEMFCTFARWTWSYGFLFVRENDKNAIVKCNLCVTPRELSTLRNTTQEPTVHLSFEIGRKAYTVIMLYHITLHRMYNDKINYILVF